MHQSAAPCNDRVHINCNCPREQKVPVEELEWLQNQRVKVGEKGGMQMAGVDSVATKKHDKYLKRKSADAEAERKRKSKLEMAEKDLLERALEEEDYSDATMDEGATMEEGEEMDTVEYVPTTAGLTKEKEREVRRLVDRMLEERLGEDYTQLVTRYLVDPSVKRNYMPVVHAARESLRLV